MWRDGRHPETLLTHPSNGRLDPRLLTVRLFAVACLCAAYFFFFARILWRNGDEGSIVYGATQVVAGEVPYRDFVDIMGPTSFYWLAGWFEVFGTSWFALRAHLLLTWVAIAVMIYWLTRRVDKSPFSALPCALYALVGIPLWPSASHHWDSLFFALLTVLCFLEWQRTKRVAWLAAAGSLAAVTSCAMPQKGAALIATACCLTVAARFVARESRIGRPLLFLVLSYAGTLAGVGLWFYWKHAFNDLIQSTVLWPLGGYQAVNHVDYAFKSLNASVAIVATQLKATDWLLPYVTIICFIPFALFAIVPAIAAALLVRAGVHHRKSGTGLDATVVTYLLFGFAMWVSELHRPDIYHLMWGSPLLIVGAFVLAMRMIPPQPLRFILSVLSLTILASGTLSAIHTMAAHQVIMTRRGPVHVEEPDPALEFVLSHVSQGAPLFVYPYYPMYYYLADVRMPSRYSILVYDYNTPEQFQEVLTELERTKVEFVLWDTLVSGENLKQWFPGYTHADDQLPMENYLMRNYDEIEVANGFRILRRRNSD